MFVLANILYGLAWVLNTVLTIYFWIVIVSALLSFVRPDPYNPVVRTLRMLTEPVFYAIRRRLPFLVQGGFDFTPIVVLLAVHFLKFALVRSLFTAAVKLGYS